MSEVPSAAFLFMALMLTKVRELASRFETQLPCAPPTPLNISFAGLPNPCTAAWGEMDRLLPPPQTMNRELQHQRSVRLPARHTKSLNTLTSQSLQLEASFYDTAAILAHQIVSAPVQCPASIAT